MFYFKARKCRTFTYTLQLQIQWQANPDEQQDKPVHLSSYLLFLFRNLTNTYAHPKHKTQKLIVSALKIGTSELKLSQGALAIEMTLHPFQKSDINESP